ncbi:MAG TPA: hypothetical protein VGN09_18440 [Vicinamibacteria bacterium]
MPAAKILTAGILVGILDGLFALALYVVALKVTTPVRLFQSIASAVLGPQSFQGGLGAAALGLLLHFTVAHAWAAVYFLALRVSAVLRRLVQAPARAVVVGMAYGVLVWLVMDLVVIPMTRTRPTPVTARSFLPVLIGHMFVVGLPIALVIRPRHVDHT